VESNHSGASHLPTCLGADFRAAGRVIQNQGLKVRPTLLRVCALFAAALALTACSAERTLPAAEVSASAASYSAASEYKMGPGDTLNIVVWHNPDVSGPTTVRPDGRISVPLIGDVVAAGKAPMALADEIREKLQHYIKDPIVTVTPTQFVGPIARQIRVVGEATQPRAIPFNTNMTLLDVMIAAGGLTRYADGDRAVIIRVENGTQQTYNVHLDSLIRDGDVTQNVAMKPGDILIIPQRFF
jgi:polysaccharide export outer membrane protein